MVRIKRAIRGLLRSAGLEVRKARYVSIEETVIPALLRSIEPVAVLDVGANVGQFASLVRSVGYSGALVSFEALPEAHAALLRASRRDAHWTVAPCAALGASGGRAEISVSKNSVSSSLLRIEGKHVEAAPESVYVGKEMTQIERLDTFAPPLIPAEGRLYLKVDTQGYEKEVLKGSTGLLSRIHALQLEMSLVSLYEGAPGFLELASFVEDLGYEIFSIVPGFKDFRDGRLLQVDGFFVRS